MEQNRSTREKPKKRTIVAHARPQLGIRIPVVTNNTELDSLLYLLPFLQTVRDGRETLSNELAQALMQETNGDRKNIIVLMLLPFLLKTSKLNRMSSTAPSSALVSSSTLLNSIFGAISAGLLFFFFRNRPVSYRDVALVGGSVLLGHLALLQASDYVQFRQQTSQHAQLSYSWMHFEPPRVDNGFLERIARVFQEMASSLKVAFYNPSPRFNVAEICAQLRPFHSLLALALLDLGIPYDRVVHILAPLFNQIEVILNPPRPEETHATASSLSMKGFFNPLESHTTDDSFYGLEDEEYFSPDEDFDQEPSPPRDEHESKRFPPHSLVFSSASVVRKDELADMEMPEDLSTSLEDKAVRILSSEGIFVYKLRTALAGCLTDDQFRLHTYWIRNSFSQLIRDGRLREEFSIAGQDLTVSLLEIVGGDVQEFIFAYNEFLNYLTHNLDSATRDAESLPVRNLNIWDVFVEYTLMDAFEQLSSLPSSLTSMLQWAPQSAKFAMVQKFVVTGLDEKIKAAQRDNNTFREKYLLAIKNVAPWLLLGFLNSDKQISTRFMNFKELFFEFYKAMFALDLRAMKSPKEHQEHVLRLSRELIEDALAQD